MAKRSPRTVRPYPRRKITGLRRKSRSAIKWPLIRQKRPRLHARPWKWRTSFDKESYQEQRATRAVRGSLQERIFYQALVDHGFIPEVDFTFQTNQLGGRAELGGLVADFVFPVPMVIVQVQSVWHTRTRYHEMRDDDQAAILSSLGFTVLELWPDTIESPGALDEWMNYNIMTLWGQSSQGIGIGMGGDTTWSDFIDLSLWQQIERLVDECLEAVR